MRILVVAPGPKFSTYDTFLYYHDAFKRLGHETFAFKYHDHYSYHAFALMQLEDESEESYSIIQRAIGLSAENLISRIARVAPDLVFIISGLALPLMVWDWMDTFKDAMKKPYKTMVLFTESPYIDDAQLPILERTDIAGTIDLSSLELFKTYNENTIYVQHAYSTSAHYIQEISRKHSPDVFVAGTGFPERIRLLSCINWDKIDLKIFGGNWGDLPESKAIEKYLIPDFLDNTTEVTRYYTNSKISPNIFRTARWPGENVLHIDPGSAYSVSPRCYEVMACGGFLLTDIRPELVELFKVGRDFESFNSSDEFESKVRFYLLHGRQRDKVALSGWRSVQGHTYENRAQKILEFVDSL